MFYLLMYVVYLPHPTTTHTHTYTYIHRYYVDGSDSARERGLQAQQTQILDTLHGDLENKTEVKCVCVCVCVYIYIYIFGCVCV
jgi:hypothetical protein